MRKLYKTTAITTLSSTLECYDFVIYALLIPYLNHNFFEFVPDSLRSVFTLLVFAIGYIARPIGGIVFGTLGDIYGRKTTFAYSVALMAIATITISLIPPSSSVGLLSTLLLIIARFLQGVSQGGEVPGAITFISEHVPYKSACTFTSLIFLGLGFGALLSSTVCYTLINMLTQEEMFEWGWRLPFMFGGILGVLSFFIRKNTDETPHYISQSSNKLMTKPAVYLIKNHSKELLKGISLGVLSSSLIAFTLTYPVYMNNYTSMTSSDTYLIMSFGMLTMALMAPVFGKLADIYGAQKMFLNISLIYILISPYLFNLITYNSFILNLIFIILIQTFIGALLGCFPNLLANLFPTKVRYTGIAISYNVAFAISSFMPAIINYVAHNSAPHFVIGIIFSVVGFFSLLIWMKSEETENFLKLEKQLNF